MDCRVAARSARDTDPEERSEEDPPHRRSDRRRRARRDGIGRRATSREPGRDPVLARPDRLGGEDDPRARRAIQQDASGHRRARRARIERRFDDAEAVGRHRLGQLSRHRLRLRLGRARGGAVEQGRRHHEGHQGLGLRVEQPLRGRPPDRHRRRQDRRLSRGDRQPRRRLQHEDPQGGRRRAAQEELDVGRLPRAREEAHESGQGHLRHRLPDLRQRGHRLAPLADDLAAGRRGARQGQQEGALRRAAGRQGAAAPERHGAQGQVALPRPDARHPEDVRPLQRGQDGDDRDGALAALGHHGSPRLLRRAGAAELRGLARDDLGARRLHGLQPLRRAPQGGGRRSCRGCTSPRRTCSGTSAAATCR